MEPQTWHYDEETAMVESEEAVIADVHSTPGDGYLLAAAPDLLYAAKLALQAIRESAFEPILDRQDVTTALMISIENAESLSKHVAKLSLTIAATNFKRHMEKLTRPDGG